MLITCSRATGYEAWFEWISCKEQEQNRFWTGNVIFWKCCTFVLALSTCLWFSKRHHHLQRHHRVLSPQSGVEEKQLQHLGRLGKINSTRCCVFKWFKMIKQSYLTAETWWKMQSDPSQQLQTSIIFRNTSAEFTASIRIYNRKNCVCLQQQNRHRSVHSWLT